jgi:hypothetical protein
VALRFSGGRGMKKRREEEEGEIFIYYNIII